MVAYDERVFPCICSMVTRAVRASKTELVLNDVLFRQVSSEKANSKTTIEIYRYRSHRYVVKHYATWEEYRHEEAFANKRLEAWYFVCPVPLKNAPRQLVLPYHTPLSDYLDEFAPMGMSIARSASVVHRLGLQINHALAHFDCMYTDIKVDNILLRNGSITEPLFGDVSGWFFVKEPCVPEYTVWCDLYEPGSEGYCAFCLTLVMCDMWTRTRFHVMSKYGGSRALWKKGKVREKRSIYESLVHKTLGSQSRFSRECAQPSDWERVRKAGQSAFFDEFCPASDNKEYALVRKLLACSSLDSWLRLVQKLSGLDHQSSSNSSSSYSSSDCL